MDKTMQTYMANLEKTSGRTIDEWIAQIRSFGAMKHGEIVLHLKNEYKMGHGYANFLAHKTLGSDANSLTSQNIDLVTEMFKGKEELQDLYNMVMDQIKAFGPDLEIAPKKAYVSLRRKKQFALIQPSTKTRLDIGLNLKGVTPSGPLEAAGNFNTMCTHRIRIEKKEDISTSVIQWLKDAYQIG